MALYCHSRPSDTPTKNQGMMTFKSVVVYEDFECAVRALDMSKSLTAQLNSGIEVDAHICRFDALNLPIVRRHMAKDASEAHVIIISVRRQGELPASVKFWFDDWLPEKRGKRGVLVALVAPENGHRQQPQFLCAYLQRKAEQAGLEFIYATKLQQPARVGRAGGAGLRPQTIHARAMEHTRRELRG